MAVALWLSNLRKNILFSDIHRNISLSAIKNLKEIKETKNGNTTIIEGHIYPDPREHLMLKSNENGACCLCSTGVYLKHTDVLILKQFLRSDGCMLPRRITGLCQVQQKRVGIMVAMAQKAGLMPNLTKSVVKKDPRKRQDWKGFNTYFDENTIKQRYY